MPSSSQPGARRSSRLRNLLVAILGLALLAGGALVAFYLAPSEEDISLVRAVRVQDRLPIPMPWTQQYDLYLVLDTAGGQAPTHTEPNAILGNGLTFPLPAAAAVPEHPIHYRLGRPRNRPVLQVAAGPSSTASTNSASRPRARGFPSP